MNEIMIDLQGGAKAPLYEKIYRHLKHEICSGRISEGEKLPSTRLLAKQLTVSRSTVEMAYEQLLAEGYILSEACRGFFVCDIRGLYQLNQRETKNRAVKQEKAEVLKEVSVDFSPDAVDTAHFPYNIWRKIYRGVLAEDREELLLPGDGQGDYGLRCVIADYLHQARGVNCTPSELIIGAGNEYLELILAQILGGGKKVLMDDPTYLQAYHTFCNLGYEVWTAPVIKEETAVLNIRTGKPDIVYVMPSHQFPLGTVMTFKRRLELLNWASEEESRFLIEDDHDSEYRYRGKPIPSLQSIDQSGSVIYMGTFSKSIAPSLRISYMVLPERLMEVYRKKCGFYSTTVPRIQQEVLREFMKGGHFGRHLNRMRAVYKSKHDFIIGELRKKAWVAEIGGDHAGLHLPVRIASGINESALCKQALEAGVRVVGISQHYIEPVQKQPEPVLLLGYGKPDEEEIKRGLNILDDILKYQL